MSTICVSNCLQKNYCYERTEKPGKNFHPEFNPDLTPKQMLALGVFDGYYFWDKPKEFPSNWFTKAKLAKDGVRDKELNYFAVSASKPLTYWQEKGWIHSNDPQGWFQWYARYYMGRRHSDDERQIHRWKMMKRHIAQVEKHCMIGDIECRPRQRQALLHWAYDSRAL